MGFTAYFMLLKLKVIMMAFAKHPSQMDECKPLTVHLTLDLSNFVKHISLEALKQKRQSDSFDLMCVLNFST